MDKETKKFPDMIFPAIMEECGNDEHGGNDMNETDSNINEMNESKVTC